MFNISALSVKELFTNTTQTTALDNDIELIQAEVSTEEVSEEEDSCAEISDASTTELETTQETIACLETTAKSLAYYDEEYKGILSQQNALEEESLAYEYPDLEKITTSSQAQEELDKVIAQITRLNTLIETAQNAIKVLEQQKATGEWQLSKQELAYAETEIDMVNLSNQIEVNEATAKREAENYEQNTESTIENYAKEYEGSEQQAQGVDMQTYLEDKMSNHQLSSSVSLLYETSETLLTTLNTKGDTLKTLGNTIDTTTNKLTNIDEHITAQNGKLEDYNQNLEAAEKYKSGLTTMRDELKRAERKKKKKRGVKGFLRKVGNTIRDTIQSVTGFVGDTSKFAGKHLGDISKSLGFGDELCEGLGKMGESASDAVGSLITVDKNELKQDLKNLEDGANLAVEDGISNTVKGIGDSMQKTGEVVSDALKYVGKHAGDIAATFGADDGTVEGAFGALGNTIEFAGNTMALDKADAEDDLKELEDNTKDFVKGTGNTIQTTGEAVSDAVKYVGKHAGDIVATFGGDDTHVEGAFGTVGNTIEFAGNTMALDKADAKDDLKDLEDNAKKAIKGTDDSTEANAETISESILEHIMTEVDTKLEELKQNAEKSGINIDDKISEIRSEIEKSAKTKIREKVNEASKVGNYQNIDTNKIKEELTADILTELTTMVK